ncbi:MAG: M48 family metallopeptidase [Massilia sp.]|nr:M48 family metallopeptidase [Massilia sp.]
MSAPKVNSEQLELFAQDFFAALEPGVPPAPPRALFQAPPRAIVPVLPTIAVPPPPRPPVAQVVPVTPTAPAALPLRRILLGAHALDYRLRRSTRRSIGFMIDDDGLRVTAPKRITHSEIDNAIRAKQQWILTKLHERGLRRAQRQEKPPMQWIDGAELPFMGALITLRLQAAVRSSCVFDPALRMLTIGVVPDLSSWQLQQRVRIWLQAEATRLFTERLALYALRLGVCYQSMALSSAGTRWGSCTTDGRIRLNWRLIHFSLPLIDYVVAHELAHLREMNHSARFWATVGSVYPDYDGARAALRLRSQELPVLFAD